MDDIESIAIENEAISPTFDNRGASLAPVIGLEETARK